MPKSNKTQILLESNKKLSITVDEWIDFSMRRYVNLTEHSTKMQISFGNAVINKSIFEIENFC